MFSSKVRSLGLLFICGFFSYFSSFHLFLLLGSWGAYAFFGFFIKRSSSYVQAYLGGALFALGYLIPTHYDLYGGYFSDAGVTVSMYFYYMPLLGLYWCVCLSLFGVAALAARWVRQESPSFFACVLACGWTLASISNERIGFPIVPLGNEWIQSFEIAQIVSVVGVYGLTLITLFFFFWAEWKRSLSIFLLIFSSFWIWGKGRLAAPIEYNKTAKVQLMQMDGKEKIIPHISINTDVGLLVWPEFAIDEAFFKNFNSPSINLYPEALSLIPPTYQGVVSITSAYYVLKEKLFNNNLKSPKNINEMFSTMGFVEGKNKNLIAAYHKVYPVTGGETLPFFADLLRNNRDYFSFFFEEVMFPISPSHNSHLIFLKGFPPFMGFICYESMLAHPFPLTDLLTAKWGLVSSNESWMRDKEDHRRVLKYNQLFAIQFGLPLLRSARGGISSTIDPFGRVLKSLPPKTSGAIETFIPQSLDIPPPYIYINGLIYFILWGVWFAFLGRVFIKKGLLNGGLRRLL